MSRKRLIKNILFVTLVPAFILTVLNIFFIYPAFDRALVTETKEEAVRLATHLGSSVTVPVAKLIHEDAAPAGFLQEIATIRRQFKLYKLNIFSEYGEVIYSTDPQDTGYITNKDFFVNVVAKGKPYAEYVKKGNMSLEEQPIDADAVEAYVPIMKKGKFLGAFEIYYDITDSRRKFERIKDRFSAILFALTLALSVAAVFFDRKSEKVKTIRRQAEADLTQEKLKSETIIAALGEGVSIQGTDYRVLYQNQVHKEFVGGDRKGDYCYQAYQQREHVCEGCHLERSFRDGKIHKKEQVRNTDRGAFYYEIISSPLKDAEGNIIAGIEVVRDITDRKKIEEQLRHAQKMEAVGTLTGGISHEFNNIMTSIIGFSEFLQEEMPADNPNRSYVEMILSSARRAANLTQGLLAFSRRQITQRRPLSVNTTIRNVEGIIARLVGERIRLEIILSDEDITVMADANQLEQTLINLSSNAKDAMPSGGTMTIRSEKIRLANPLTVPSGDVLPGEYALITVRDTGTGMDENTRGKIFEPFFTTKEVGKGTGLGLAVVIGIIEKNGGHIDVNSSPGMGTTFKIYLPSVEEKAEAPAAASKTEPQRGTETILLAEDDPEVRELIKTLLLKSGYAVLEASDGEEAIGILRENGDSINLLLVDIVMPKKNGTEVYAEAEEMRPGTKVIFISGYSNEILQSERIHGKEIPFVQKPISPNLLLGAIRTALDEESESSAQQEGM